MTIPDPSKKTVKIPVKVVNGQVQFFYGGVMPKISDTVGDLVIPAYALINQTDGDNLSYEDVSELLPKGSVLLINVRVDESGPGLITRSYLGENLPDAPKPGFVKVMLSEPLRLWHRGTKSSVLSPCVCYLPGLKIIATSLNHAYTIASKKFETNRLSNTGNVFLHVYHRGKHGWEQLEWLRARFDAKFAQRYIPTENARLEDFQDGSPLVDGVTAEREQRRPSSITGVLSDCGESFEEAILDGEQEGNFDRLMSEGWYHYDRYFIRFNRRRTATSVPLRVDLSKFKLSKSQRRVLKLNADLDLDILPLSPEMNDAEVLLFNRHRSRLGSNAPEKVKLPRPNAHNKKIWVFENGHLIAASYLEMGNNSSYGYYGIFSPEIKWRSLGIFTMLKEIEYSIEQRKEFYYMGYSFEHPSIYDYKKRFHALERYDWHGFWKKYPRLTESTSRG